MGFDAVWISPVVEQIDDPSRAYHGYSAQDIYSLNSNFGTTSDLHNLANDLHSRGMVSIPCFEQILGYVVHDRNLCCSVLIVFA